MAILNLPASQETNIVRPLPWRVYVNGQRRRELQALSVEWSPAEGFGRARVAAVENLDLQSPQWHQTTALPEIGARMSIRPPSPEEGAAFHGIVSEHVLEAHPEGDRLTAVADHELCSLLATPISTLIQSTPKGLVELAGAIIRFNEPCVGLGSATSVEVRNRQAHVFDASTDAKAWTVAGALGYLLAAAVPASVSVPSVEELMAIAGDLPLGVVDVTGLTAAQALVKIAKQGGLTVRATHEGIGLTFFRRGLDGRRTTISMQSAGSSLSANQSNLWQGKIHFGRRPSRPGVMAIGQHKRFECTLPLQPGWDEAIAGHRWRDFNPSLSGDWLPRAQVYRRWVLNEHGWYCSGPWNLPRYDLAAISKDDFTLTLPRRLLPCLSTDISGQSLGILVQFRVSDSDPWQNWKGPVWVSPTECAVYLGGNSLPADYFEAAVSGTVEVRVTATLEADSLLTAAIPSKGGCEMKVVEFGSRAAWSRVHTSSIFAGRTDLGKPAQRDDSALLLRLAQRYRDALRSAMEAQLTLGWVDAGFRVGDVIDRIQGRDLEVKSSAGTSPSIIAVRHDLENFRTHLTVKG